MFYIIKTKNYVFSRLVLDGILKKAIHIMMTQWQLEANKKQAGIRGPEEANT